MSHCLAPEASSVSGSLAIGSSEKNLGSAVWHDGQRGGDEAHAATVVTKRRCPAKRLKSVRGLHHLIPQNAALAENTRASPSLLLANSIRSGVVAGPCRRNPMP